MCIENVGRRFVNRCAVELLRQRNLPTSGTKAELVMRLNTADPEGTWKLPPTEEEGATEEEATANDAMISVGNSANSGVTSSSQQTEQLLRREIELLRRKQNERGNYSSCVAKMKL